MRILFHGFKKKPSINIKLICARGRDIAVHPTDSALLLCGVSDRPTGTNVHGQLYRSDDAGRNWVHMRNGFPESTRKNIDTFHIQFERDDAWISDENNLYHSQDKGRT